MNAILTSSEFFNSTSVVTKTPLLNEGTVESKRTEILAYFHKTFSLYESLFDCLVDDDAYYARANMLRHPLIFYYGHTAVFYINKLNVAKLINERIDPHLESTLAIGVDEMSWDDLNEAHYNWPTPATVKAYRDKTRDIVSTFIKTYDFTLPITFDDPMWVIIMGIEHERIHLETSAVLVRELPLDKVRSHKIWSNICTETGAGPLNELIDVPGGEVAYGKDKSNPLYGWDNEFGRAKAVIKKFKASKYLVSNMEFLEFIKADGYQTRSNWDDEGWHWVQYVRAEHPVYWVKDGNGYKYRSMLEVIDMPWNWPADLNYLESKAFCNWKSAQAGKSIRMLTEAEWYHLRDQNTDTDQPYWAKAPGNINLEYEMSPCPVDRHEFQGGFFDIIGNVWQSPINRAAASSIG